MDDTFAPQSNNFMKQFILPSVVLIAALSVTSCKKDESTKDPSVKPYTVPTTYEFSNANFSKSKNLVAMTVEIDAYLKTANVGSSVVVLDPSKLSNMFSNTGSPFSNASLNSTGFNVTSFTADAALYKSFADSGLLFNNGTTASQGVGGFVPRGSNKIIVGPRGLEYSQAYVKGVMGALHFKEAVRLLTEVKSLKAADTATAQSKWDEAFGHLAVPVNYDTNTVYAGTDPNRPLLWGGYLAERGKAIQAGGTLFSAFLKGRAAIGGYDANVRNQQADIIIAKWEQLAAAAALAYMTSPTASSAAGNLGTQFHALSEGFGFILSLKYRPASSKLSASDFEKLNAIIHKDFYDLVSQPGFSDLVAAQNILKNTYGL